MKLKLNKKQIVVLAVLLILILILPLALSLTKQRQEIRKKAAGTEIAKLGLGPAQISLNRGENKEIAVYIHSLQQKQVGAADVKLTFNTNVFNISNIVCDTRLSTPVPDSNKVVNNAIFIGCYTGAGATFQANTPVNLAKFTVTVKENAPLGETPINFELTAVGEYPDGNDISDAGTTATYTISSVATPTPLPTPLPGQERVVGRVWKNNTVQTGYNIISHDGKTAGWNTNEEGAYYEFPKSWATGSVVRITLNNPDAGYICSWSFDNNPNQAGGETTGQGCSAVVTLGSTSWEWQNHLAFFLTTPPTSTPTLTITPTPTRGATGTPTPTVTSTPGEVKIKVKVVFPGVSKACPSAPAALKAKCETQGIKIMVVKNNQVLADVANFAVSHTNQIVVFGGIESAIYESAFLALPNTVTAGSNYVIFVKGPKHLQTKYCALLNQTRPCTAGNTINLINGENTLDFTKYPLLAGDLPHPTYGQDGVVNSLDATYLTSTCFADPEGTECLNRADLNLDGAINTLDMGLLNNTIYTRWEDE